MKKPIYIGKVKIDYIEGASKEYSDGEAEDLLLDIFKSKDPQKQIDKILKANDSWPMVYHLSPLRRNILSWYEFEDGAEILEIGAGPGAITSALVNKNVKVTAIELSEQRATINAHKHKDFDNLNIIVGNLEKLSTTKKFDYVVCVGVLEYAGSYFSAEKPYEHFLNQLKKSLKPGGKLLLAIENKFGLKYWAGIPEDHTGRPHDSIQDYAGSPKKVRTFAKQELTGLLEETGFKNSRFYFPHPDYKLPTIVYSDDFYPGNGTEFPIGSLPSNDYTGQEKSPNFHETLAMLSVEKSNLYPEFANSFLVESQVE